MRLIDVFLRIEEVSSTNAKKAILQEQQDNELLKTALVYAYDPFKNFYVVKVPEVKHRTVVSEDNQQWLDFFDVLDKCEARVITGNEAVEAVHAALAASSIQNESWMRRILKHHLNIGVASTQINKVWPNLIPTFDVQLAETLKREKERKGCKSWKKLLEFNPEFVAVEPKLDGVRCITVVKDGVATMYSRSGNVITNFDKTVCPELVALGPGVYDGEIMSKSFQNLMTQYRRKDNVDVSEMTYNVFDWLPLDEWMTKKTKLTCQERREKLEDMDVNGRCKHVRLVKRDIVALTAIKAFHDQYVAEGYEGLMVKLLTSPYKFDRTYDVMKLKDFYDIDLEIAGFYPGKAGTKHENSLGGVVTFVDGVEVRIGSGWSDQVREYIWANKDECMGRVIEVRYQEKTDDGSLRFPTFKRFRNDK